MFSNHPFEQMNRLVEQMHRSMWDASVTAGSSTRPAVQQSIDTNVRAEETDDGYVVMVDLPGFEKDELSVRFEDGVLTIHGESELSEESDHVSHHRSRRVHEQLRLPETVRDDDITASYHNGVLEVTVPTDEMPEDDTHRIDIE